MSLVHGRTGRGYRTPVLLTTSSSLPGVDVSDIEPVGGHKRQLNAHLSRQTAVLRAALGFVARLD